MDPPNGREVHAPIATWKRFFPVTVQESSSGLLRVFILKNKKEEGNKTGYEDSLGGVVAFEVGRVFSWKRDDNFSPSEYQLIIIEDHIETG